MLKKCTIVMEDVIMREAGTKAYRNSVKSFQLFCKSKIILKRKFIKMII